MLVTPGWVGPTQLGGHSVKANTTQHSKLKNRLKEREYSATKKALTLWYRNGDFIYVFFNQKLYMLLCTRENSTDMVYKLDFYFCSRQLRF